MHAGRYTSSSILVEGKTCRWWAPLGTTAGAAALFDRDMEATLAFNLGESLVAAAAADALPIVAAGALWRSRGSLHAHRSGSLDQEHGDAMHREVLHVECMYAHMRMCRWRAATT